MGGAAPRRLDVGSRADPAWPAGDAGLGRAHRHADRGRRGRACWSVPREALRDAKEALRSRLYRPGQREVRDRVLAALGRRFEEWRSAAA